MLTKRHGVHDEEAMVTPALTQLPPQAVAYPLATTSPTHVRPTLDRDLVGRLAGDQAKVWGQR